MPSRNALAKVLRAFGGSSSVPNSTKKSCALILQSPTLPILHHVMLEVPWGTPAWHVFPNNFVPQPAPKYARAKYNADAQSPKSTGERPTVQKYGRLLAPSHQ